VARQIEGEKKKQLKTDKGKTLKKMADNQQHGAFHRYQQNTKTGKQQHNRTGSPDTAHFMERIPFPFFPDKEIKHRLKGKKKQGHRSQTGDKNPECIRFFDNQGIQGNYPGQQIPVTINHLFFVQ
jgi:hypothetical protein